MDERGEQFSDAMVYKKEQRLRTLADLSEHLQNPTNPPCQMTV